MGKAPRSLLAALLFVAGWTAEGAPREAPRPPAVVEPRFDLDTPSGGPFPSDRLTVPDVLQRTGLRVGFPLPNCAVARSDCDDVRLLNELDGFDLAPRVAVPFSGPIDPSTVTARSVFLVRLAPGPPEATAVERLVYDATSHTLYARPEAILEPETRYGLVVTRGVRDASGRPLQVSGAFHRLVREGREGACCCCGGGPPGARGYRQGLVQLMAALARRGIRSEDVAVASVFTTGSVTGFLEAAREALDRRPPAPALMTAPEEGGRAYFAREALTSLVFRRQVRVATAAEDAFEEAPLPLAALPREAVAGVGVGWYWSPSYLTRERRIVEGPSGRPGRGAPLEVPVPFVIVLPAGKVPARGWPLALFGHGYGGEMFSSALLIAGTLARHGIATAAIDVVGHGGGPESRLLVRHADGRTLTVRVPGRGADLDGDGRIGRTEGIAPPLSGPLASLSLRDGLRQQAVDLMAFVRAARDGLDVEGFGVRNTGAPTFYAGQSLGGIYGALFLAVEPRLRIGALNVVGGPLTEIARLSPVFRPFVRDALGLRAPSLLNRGREFREDLPLRGESPVTDLAPGAVAIQEHLARVEWLGRRGDPVAYARHLRETPLGGAGPARVLVQFATGDRTVPNPTTSAFVRAGQLADATTLLRYDRVAVTIPKEWVNPHAFLLRVSEPGAVGALARAAQEQVARFFRDDRGVPWSPDETSPPPFTEAVFEVPATSLPDRLGYHREEGSP